MIRNVQALCAAMRDIHIAIRDRVIQACEQMSMERLASVVAEQAGDTVFAIDRISEEVLLAHFARLGQDWSFVLIAEGLGKDGTWVFPQGITAEQAELRIIIDPIDGTRGLMYQKRPAWILTGVAPNRGSLTNLADIELAVQTEVPLIKQHLCDSFWVIKGQGVVGERFNRLTGEHQILAARPSQAQTIVQGYGGIARFFPGGRAELAALDDAIVEQVLGPMQQGKVLAFEDQYISSGGQLYELLMGHDRWLADLRPLIPALHRSGLCCHPYDLCTELIAREAGLIITDEHERLLHAPLDVTTDMAWMGYANAAIHKQIAPVLHELLVERHLLP